MSDPAPSPARARARRWAKVVIALLVLLIIEGASRVSEWRGRARRAGRSRTHYSLEVVARDGTRISSAEGTVRLELDPVATYRLAPDHAAPGITVNALGLRGAMPQAEPRVLLLGGSTAFGWGASKDDAAPAPALSRALATEVLCGAVPGYTTWQEAASLAARQATLRPTLVVSLTGYNDVAFSSRRLEAIGNEVLAQLETRAQNAYDLLPALVHASATGRRLFGRRYDPAVLDPGARPEAIPPAAVDLFGQALVTLAALTKGRLVVALQPAYLAHRERPPAEREAVDAYIRADATYGEFVRRSLDLLRARLKDAEALGAVVVDLSAMFDGDPAVAFTDEVHLTDEANAKLAEALAAAVKRHPAWGR